MSQQHTSETRSVFALRQDHIAAMFDRLAASMTVLGAAERDGRFVYRPMERADELRLDFETTAMPPTVYLLPAKEELVRLRLGPSADGEAVSASEPIALFGVHPYDLHAIALLDEVFLGANPDPNYASRRNSTFLIGIDCDHPIRTSFAAGMGTDTIEEGFDLLLSNIGEGYLVTVGSDRGLKLLEGLEGMTHASEEQLSLRARRRQEATERYAVRLDTPRDRVPRLLTEHYDSAYWDERSEPCFSCGSCITVCPTCFCFDVQDEVSLDLKTATRVRRWDGCMLSDFALVAGGENFRPTKASRFRHRMLRKGKYILERYGRLGCVGCGRCGIACLTDIASPAETFNAIAARDQEMRQAARAAAAGATEAYVPEAVTVARIETLAAREKLFVLEPCGGTKTTHLPGQFVMVSVAGIGEAPISVSSSPTRGETIELAVRDVGKVTHALHRLEAGARIGIRGPFGNGFPLADLEWKDLLLVAGGIGLFPLRSLVQYVLDCREQFGKVTILYGARSPSERMFGEDVAAWAARDDVKLLQTVDVGDDGWDGPVGVITTLIPPLELDPGRTMSVVVGPPVMYRFVVAELRKKGLGDAQIVISLERHMKCGTGKCGHCQINGKYVCQDGPVFTLEQLRDLPEGVE